METPTPLSVGPSNIQKEGGELGQQTLGPINYVMKYYVRRKETKDYNVEAQSVLEPPKETTPQPYEACLKACKKDPRDSIHKIKERFQELLTQPTRGYTVFRLKRSINTG